MQDRNLVDSDLASETKQDEIKDLIGEVQASPTENTTLDRLKDLLTGIVLATGSNAIGKLAANSGVDIGDVDVTSSALPAGAATETTLAAQSAKLPATLGQKASAVSLSSVLSTEQEVILTAIQTAVASVNAVTTATLYNVTMTLADTEYSQALPANTKQLEFRCQGNFDIRFAYVTSKVATPTAPYRTLAAGLTKNQNGLDLTSITLYVACSQAAQVVELEVWT